MKDRMHPNICVSLAGLSAREILIAIKGLRMAEIRLDGMKLEREDIKTIFSASVELIATCRPGNLNDRDRAELLIGAIDSGASYVDIEIGSKKRYRESIIKEAKKVGCKVILSYHNYEMTPSESKLKSIVDRCKDYGGDIVKIACRANSYSDSARLLGLLGRNGNIVVVGMGEKGRITRIVAPILGSPFTFASLSKGMETADGQIELGELKRMMEVLT